VFTAAQGAWDIRRVIGWVRDQHEAPAVAVSGISLGGYNLTNAEYSHHNSLIKDMAPQMGRGFRISYSLRFY